MKTLIVFNGGAEGALLVSTFGVTTVPSFPPDVHNTLRATARLVLAMASATDRSTQGKLTKLAIGTANLSIDMIENLLGELDPERSIVYHDDDGGFSCGSTGKPPMPIYWPPRPNLDAEALVKSGAIEADTLEVIRQTKANGGNLSQVFEDPAGAAKALGLTLSAKSVSDLSMLAPSRISKVKDPVDQEMLRLFHAVLRDGRFTETWFEKPREVARELKVKIGDVAVQRILGITSQATQPGIGPSARGDSAICAGIVWAGVCIAVGTLFVGQMNPIDTLVVDRSGKAKL